VSSIRSILCEETTEIILRHLEALGQYVPASAFMIDMAPENVLRDVERLAAICQCSPQCASSELYREACDCQDDLQSFLDTMNQTLDSDFKETCIGRVFTRASRWRFAARQAQPLVTDVWAFIAPAIPDHLEHLGAGQYEARWWKPVPIMDIEILKYTEGVVISGEPFEPVGLSGGLALQFSLAAPT
jgi:hypothetical protein